MMDTEAREDWVVNPIVIQPFDEIRVIGNVKLETTEDGQSNELPHGLTSIEYIKEEPNTFLESTVKSEFSEDCVHFSELPHELSSQNHQPLNMIKVESVAEENPGSAMKPEYCGVCNEFFQCDGELRAHNGHVHSGESSFNCPFCFAIFEIKGQFDKHTRKHLKHGCMPYDYLKECALCSLKFLFRSSFDEHMKIHSLEIAERSSLSNADTGNMDSVGSDHEVSVVDQCVKMEIPNIAEKVKQEPQAQSSAQFKCGFCMVEFTHNELLVAHVSTHTSKMPRVKLHECSLCFEVFFCIDQLKEHTRNHTVEKPFECHVCGRKFSQKRGLIRHENTHIEKKTYLCSVCCKTFAQKSHLEWHTSRKHPSKKPAE